MTTVTKLVLRSGDRAALEDVVGELKASAHRKGARIAGPHSDPPKEYTVPLYKRLDGEEGELCGQWDYTVYSRRIEITGPDELVRRSVDHDYPAGVQVEIEIEQVRDAGR